MNWQNEVLQRKDQLIKDTQELLRIKSVSDDSTKSEMAPFGQGIKEALDYALDKCAAFGMDTKNVDGYAGHADIGQGEELVGILCHLDVVPEGDGWTHPPYAAEIHDGKLYARGSIDDKGPTMAAIYAMRIIKENNLHLNKKVRIIFGTDEESGWKDMDYYFAREKMPAFGFAPDADFPIIITEKGILNVHFEGKDNAMKEEGKGNIMYFSAGRRPNMVPDNAVVHIEGNFDQLSSFESEFNAFLNDYQYGGSSELTDSKLVLNLNGVSAHGMEPFKGVNAGLELINFLLLLQGLRKNDWMTWLNKYFYQDYFGSQFGIKYEDEISGDLTINLGIIKFEENAIDLTLNIRYPVTTNYEEMVNILTDTANKINLKTRFDNSKPHHVEKDNFLVKTLKNVYEEQTGQEATLLAIGGGTYARALETGVAFGPLFPGKIETAHQKDEHIEVDDLLKTAAIYAQAIYELAK